jgi:putative ABC transport system permease protein
VKGWRPAMVSALDRKMLRDLWGMKGQALAIAFVVAGGVALIMSDIGSPTSGRRSCVLPTR